MRLKSYNKEEITELIVIRFSTWWRPEYSVQPVTIEKITDKTVMVKGGPYARLTIDNVGVVLHGAVYCLPQDEEEIIQAYKEQRSEELNIKIDALKEELDNVKNLKRGERV